MRSIRMGGMLAVGVIVVLSILLTHSPVASATAIASPTAGSISWFPLVWYGSSPWKPTATPTPTATATSTPTPTRTPTITPTPTPALSIRALEYSGRDEYVEIYNAGPGPQAFAGWKLRSAVGEQWYEFPWGISLPAGGWLRVHSGPDAYEALPTHLKWGSAYIWNNDGDEAELYDGHEHLVDRWSY